MAILSVDVVGKVKMASVCECDTGNEVSAESADSEAVVAQSTEEISLRFGPCVNEGVLLLEDLILVPRQLPMENAFVCWEMYTSKSDNVAFMILLDPQVLYP